jgi:hypothetical protein
MKDLDPELIEEMRVSFMKLGEAALPKFDPEIRLREGRTMYVVFVPEDWYKMELSLGKHISTTEIRDLIMGVFCGTHKIVKR